VIFRNIDDPKNVTVKASGRDLPFVLKYDSKKFTLTVTMEIEHIENYKVEIAVDGQWKVLGDNTKKEIFMEMLKQFRLKSVVKQAIFDSHLNIFSNPSVLLSYTPSLSYTQAQALFEAIMNCGIHRVTIGEIDTLIIWNGNDNNTSVAAIYYLTGVDLYWKKDLNYSEMGPLPSFKAVDIKKEFRNKAWRLVMNYCGGFQCEYFTQV